MIVKKKENYIAVEGAVKSTAAAVSRVHTPTHHTQRSV